MENVPKDVIVEKLALKLDFNDVINYCKSSKKYNVMICNNNLFWIKYIYYNFNIKFDIRNKNLVIEELKNAAFWLDYLKKNRIHFK